jgi:hypothetical protein
MASYASRVTFRIWARLAWNSLGAAAIVAAAQLGVSDQLGVLKWGQRYDNGHSYLWSAQLTWVAFIAAVSVISGAALGQRSVRRPGKNIGIWARITAVVGAGVGATAIVPLVWLAARGAHPPTHLNPELTAVIAGAAGIVGGMILSVVALSISPFAGNLVPAVAWVWLAAIGSAVLALRDNGVGPRLGVLEWPHLADPTAKLLRTFMMGALALVIGLIVAAVARWGGVNRVTIALSGLAGPGLIAIAYAVGGPGVGPDRAGQLEPYQGAMYAAGAGLLASLAVAAVGRRRKPVIEVSDEYADPEYPWAPPVDWTDEYPVSPAPYQVSPAQVSPAPYQVSPARPTSGAPYSPSRPTSGAPYSPSRPTSGAPYTPSRPTSGAPYSPSRPRTNPVEMYRAAGPVSPAPPISPAPPVSPAPPTSPAPAGLSRAVPVDRVEPKTRPITPVPAVEYDDDEVEAPAKPAKGRKNAKPAKVPQESRRAQRQVAEYEGWLQELSQEPNGDEPRRNAPVR